MLLPNKIAEQESSSSYAYFWCFWCTSITFCTSSSEPMKIPDRSWMCSGTTSSMRSILLLTAFPPAADHVSNRPDIKGFTTGDLPFSKTMAIGAHSYKIRSLPLGLFLSAGYAKIPP
jgi:hypothetical protein